jgi:hypothetical protein
MKTWYLWVGLALLALLLLSGREGFAATATIRNPNTWDTAELTRIKAMVTPTSTSSDEDIRRVVGGFWSIWDSATTRITLNQVNSYLDTTPNLGAKRNEYRDLIQKYYIDQGQSVFTEASGYAELATPPTAPAPPAAPAPPTTIERPSSASQTLKQEIATTAGIPLTDETSINAFVTQVQKFYDSVYLPTKATPSYTQMMSFADSVSTANLPATIGNNFKIHLVTILQRYFTPQSGSSVSPLSGGGLTAGAFASSMTAEGGAEGGQTLGTGKNVQGPESGGRDTSGGNTTGGLGIPRNYPVLYGGTQEYTSAIPGSGSLGSDPMSRFLPYSRIPGDQDMYPDPYRLGKYFSTSSYSGKDAPDPAPFLADFSKFFT